MSLPLAKASATVTPLWLGPDVQLGMFAVFLELFTDFELDLALQVFLLHVFYVLERFVQRNSWFHFLAQLPITSQKLVGRNLVVLVVGQRHDDVKWSHHLDGS